MLATRQLEPEHNSYWSTLKIETVLHRKSPANPRMSTFETTNLPTQPNWQGQYPFALQGNSSFAQPYGQQSSSAANGKYGASNEATAQPRTTATAEAQPADVPLKTHNGTNSAVDYKLHVDSSSLRNQHTHTTKPLEQQHQLYEQKPTDAGAQDEPMNGTEVHSTPAGASSPTRPRTGAESQSPKEEDDEVDGDEVAEGEEETCSRPQTAAERAAQRRKMKRFRLTHQQTRFLMSEFAKQPHPDAGHRERLSRQIPGLSPRQVQVWFQNR